MPFDAFEYAIATSQFDPEEEEQTFATHARECSAVAQKYRPEPASGATEVDAHWPFSVEAGAVVVQGEEWRAFVANFMEFYAKSTVGWEKPTEHMRELAQTAVGLPAHER